ncbi:response regulator transcription factor [Algibacter pectinivorans]|uniref:Two component transcriptional regulator, LuxR family n=1 Tax=Algibacter pectinivorans TaxID=870482 RepID=A0A1I1P5H3_9FLAO|nr:response regulator transcription factor [Algibacter pectinivorans]SFD04985.1 two component transcriptional regulator, LuxR family [Algibacter pectinivorans]
MHYVAVVDDFQLLAQAMSTLVNSFKNFQVCYSCNNGKEIIEKLDASLKLPDIILMDVNMPILNGIQATKYIKDKYPNIKVIAISVENKTKDVLQMLEAGAKSYLLKDIEKSTLEIALTETINKGYYHTEHVSKILVDALHGQEKPMTVLKEREMEFLNYACTDKTYKEIADKMFLSPKTIDGYRNTLFNKFNVKNRVGLVLYAIRNQLFNP